jgi:hypothetical protein
VKNFTWWQPIFRNALVVFTNGDHGAPVYRMRCSLATYRPLLTTE